MGLQIAKIRAVKKMGIYSICSNLSSVPGLSENGLETKANRENGLETKANRVKGIYGKLLKSAHHSGSYCTASLRLQTIISRPGNREFICTTQNRS